MKHLKKIALLELPAIDMDKLIQLPRTSVIIDDKSYDTILKYQHSYINIIHGALYKRPEYDKALFIFEDNLETLERNQNLKSIIDSYKGHKLYIEPGNLYIDGTNNNIIDLPDDKNMEFTSFNHEYRDIDPGLHNRVWSHGLAAFSSDTYWLDNLKFIIEHPEAEIACSKYTENIGPVGIYVKGKVVEASHTDIWSDKTKNLRRVWDTEHVIPMTTKNISDNLHSHGEIVLTNTEVVGMWVRKNIQINKPNYINKEYLKKALILKKEFMSKIAYYKNEVKNIINAIQNSLKIDFLDQIELLEVEYAGRKILTYFDYNMYWRYSNEDKDPIEELKNNIFDFNWRLNQFEHYNIFNHDEDGLLFDKFNEISVYLIDQVSKLKIEKAHDDLDFVARVAQTYNLPLTHLSATWNGK